MAPGPRPTRSRPYGRSLAPPPNLPLVNRSSDRDAIVAREQGAKKLFPGHRSSNRAYLHDVRHHGPQLSEGPTQNRRNGDAKQGFSSHDHASLARAVRAFGRETNFVSKRIPNLLPSGFQGVYLASWGALIRPASYNRHTRPKGQRLDCGQISVSCGQIPVNCGL